MSLWNLLWIIPVIIVIIAIISDGMMTVDEATVAIIQRLGKFKRVAEAGFSLKIPLFDSRVKDLSLRVQELTVKVDVKTRDNVFFSPVFQIQFQVIREKAKDAYYKLTEPGKQITSFVQDVVRVQLCSMSMDDAFASQKDIEDKAIEHLKGKPAEYGYEIVKVLVVDLSPPKSIQDAMNAVIENERLKIAAKDKAEAQKIAVVTEAGAEAESQRLRGEGFANARAAILEGAAKTMKKMREDFPQLTPEGIEAMFVRILELHVAETIGNHPGNRVLLMPFGANIGSSIGEVVAGVEAAKSGGVENRPSKCPRCGKGNSLDSRFCIHCGTSIKT